MSDYLPSELLIQILVKLPVKPLIRFTTVCKSWRSIITSPDFISSHLSNNGQNQTLCLVTSYGDRSKLDQFSLLRVSENNGSFAVNSSSELEFPVENDHVSYLRVADSCDGLVCLSNDLFGNPSTTIIWNPSVRNHIVLPNPTINPTEPCHVILGFGVASHAHIKVVRLVYCENSNGRLCVPPQVEIFSHVTRSWRRVLSGVDDVTLRANTSTTMCCQTFLNGVVHWIAKEESGDKNCSSSILAIDIGDEVVGEVMLPYELASEIALMMSIHVIGESLGIVRSDYRDNYDVWMMKEYGVKESWVKLYRIVLDVEIHHVVGFSKSGEALMVVWERGLVAYNPETNQTKDLGIYGFPYSLFVDNYVESLLLLR